MLGLAGLSASVIALGLASPVASTVSFSLRAHVPVSCTIQGLETVPENRRALRVSTSCNAENIRLTFGGDLADNRIQAVNSGVFTGSFGIAQVDLRQLRPGTGMVEIVFEDEIRAATSSSVSISGF